MINSQLEAQRITGLYLFMKTLIIRCLTLISLSQVADCYMKLSSWNEVADWQKHVNNLRKQCSDSEVQHSLMANIDMNYVK